MKKFILSSFSVACFNRTDTCLSLTLVVTILGGVEVEKELWRSGGGVADILALAS